MRNLFARRQDRELPADQESIEVAVVKTREGAFGRISNLFRQQIITEETWDELEDLLIQADVGPSTALKLVGNARRQVERDGLQTPVEAETAVRRQMVEILGNDVHEPLENMPAGTIILVVGVNGSGKTTTVAKLASYLERHGRTVLLAAADTFRAAAIDQLRIWSERVRVPVVAHQPNADPGAVVFDAVKAAQARNVDFVIVDTAGRLHTKFNLMEELEKIRRVAQNAHPGARLVSLLVLDATTGQNAILQATSFLKAAGADGIILAKLDGTAKGGVAFSVHNELGIPIWFVGTGEKAQDLAPFHHLEFVNALFE
jgi:fused signal recognition particle receptor